MGVYEKVTRYPPGYQHVRSAYGTVHGRAGVQQAVHHQVVGIRSLSADASRPLAVGGTLNGMLVARYGALVPLKIRPVGQVARSRSIKGAVRSSLRIFTFDSEGSEGTASSCPTAPNEACRVAAAAVLLVDLPGCGSVALKIDPRVSAEQSNAQQTWRLKMSATLKLTHKAIGVEVRRGTFDRRPPRLGPPKCSPRPCPRQPVSAGSESPAVGAAWTPKDGNR
jgi:hypothetical protein